MSVVATVQPTFWPCLRNLIYNGTIFGRIIESKLTAVRGIAVVCTCSFSRGAKLKITLALIERFENRFIKVSHYTKMHKAMRNGADAIAVRNRVKKLCLTCNACALRIRHVSPKVPNKLNGWSKNIRNSNSIFLYNGKRFM